MSTVSGRKKSVASSAQIEQPIATSSHLNKSASSASSLYQQCSQLRARLLGLPDFATYFALAAAPDSARRSTDPVTQLWDCLALGLPLCHIYNFLPTPYTPINIDTDPSRIDPTNDRVKKRAIALFSMQVKQLDLGCDQFTVTDLTGDRNSQDGFVKVVDTVTRLVDRLPEDVFSELPPSPTPGMSAYESTDSLATSGSGTGLPISAKEAARNNILREMVETERKFVQDLEVMQKYAVALSSSIDQDTIHHLFPNLNKLLNFQRKFLIRFEGIYELAWKDQRWGLPFIENEEEFAVYEPYCGNYNHAADLGASLEQSLSAHNHLINAKSELPAFLIKPVQRICKYPLLLESLIKATSGSDYPHHTELAEGLAAAKRITDKINEAQRRAENELTVKNLVTRVEDWKGHALNNFGDLLLDDLFVVTKSDVDREYHVFLFEKIILCCKECPPGQANGKRIGKSNSILKKPGPAPLTSLPGGVGPPKKTDTPLMLKGRIFLTNVTQAIPSTRADNAGYALAVWWSGEDDLEYFTLQCRTQEQMRKWESQINKLIKEIAERRVSERNTPNVPPAPAPSNSTNPARPADPTKSYSTGAINWPTGPPNARNTRQSAPPGRDRQTTYSSRSGPDGFDEAEDEYEDYPPAGSTTSSGRGTPVGSRRDTRREDEPRSGLPSAPSLRPSLSRLASAASDASFGPGVKQRAASTIRSQFSSTKLRTTYEKGSESSRATMPAQPSRRVVEAPGSARVRSTSQPGQYGMPRQAAPPPPLPSPAPWGERAPTSSANPKRGSGSSQSTGESSDYSPHTSSPVTPYGSSESSLGVPPAPRYPKSAPATNMYMVKVKVYFNEDIFVMQVPTSVEYAELVEKVGKKIRLCGPRYDDGPLRVKYRDEDGDMVSLGSTEDIQLAFDGIQPSGTVTLYVT